MSAPCFKCGAAGTCSHREAEPTLAPPNVDMRSVPQPAGYGNRKGIATGQGYNFQGEKAQRIKAALRRRREQAAGRPTT